MYIYIDIYIYGKSCNDIKMTLLEMCNFSILGKLGIHICSPMVKNGEKMVMNPMVKNTWLFLVVWVVGVVGLGFGHGTPK